MCQIPETVKNAIKYKRMRRHEKNEHQMYHIRLSREHAEIIEMDCLLHGRHPLVKLLYHLLKNRTHVQGQILAHSLQEIFPLPLRFLSEFFLLSSSSFMRFDFKIRFYSFFLMESLGVMSEFSALSISATRHPHPGGVWKVALLLFISIGCKPIKSITR